MSVIAITGVAGYLGPGVLERLERDESVARIIGVDVAEPIAGSPKLEFHQLDVRDRRLAKVLAGADAIVHLAFQHDHGRDLERMRSVNVDGTAGVLEAAAAVGVTKIVYPSSATVYGAHPDNPVPLTEDAPLRANESFAYAVQKLETERLVDAFRASERGVTVTVLRPAIAFGATVENFVTRMLDAPRLLTVRGHHPPLQVVHEQDLSSAIVLALQTEMDGVYNIAADGWLSADEVARITGKKRVEIPEAVAFSMAQRLWRTGLTSGPPGELHFVMHPWVVDTAKARAAGWEPRHTNAQALAASVAARRDYVALGRARMRKDSLAKGAAATLGAVGAMAVARRARRRGA